MAFNEDGYEVYRATDSLGAYTLLNPNPSNQNAVGYTDNSQFIPNLVYYYKVRAFNTYGFSAYATVAGVTFPNNKPVLAAIANQSMNVNEVVNVNITAADDPGEQLTLSASNLPSFATFVDNGNGNGTLKLSPIVSQTGNFNVSITVNDNFGGSDSKNVSITVSDPVEVNRPVAPSNLTSVTQSKTSVTLSWKDNSNNETGFEVWRSATRNGTYDLVATVGANITSYVDNGLANGSLFFYKVRAKNNSIFSTYSNTVAASPISYVLNINFNEGSADSPPQPAPWNNTNATPYNGYALNNLLNDQNQRSGVNFLLPKKFTTYLNVGKSTGNNTGIFPDNVMKSCWFIDPSDTAKITINNLNQTMKYNLIFFGSQGNLSGNRITNYQIGDQIVKLNCTNNTSNTVQIVGIVPDNTGSINIKVFAEDKTLLGYLNAMVIQGYYSADPDVASTLQNQITYQPTSLMGTKSSISTSLQNKKAEADSLKTIDNTAAIAYPNPFVDDIILKVNFTKNIGKFNVVVTDMAGRTIHANEFNDIKRGVWQQKIGLNGKALKNGIYLIQVLIPGEKATTIKVIK